MNNNRKVAAVVITAVAITGTASTLANAAGTRAKSVTKTSKTTITQIHMRSGISAPGMGFRNLNKEAVITATLGIDATTLRSRLAAGETLAAIAGAKKDALIAALVADETKQIDAAVTAGKLTAAQATTLKAALTAHITAEVESTRPMGGPMDRMGRMDDMGGFKNSNKEAVITATLGIDATTLRSRLAAGETLASIAGAKKDALIAALVADETKRIDAAVTAGKLTAAQASTLKAGLTAHITAEVESTRPLGGPMGRMGDVDDDGHMGRMGGHMGGRGHHGMGNGGQNGMLGGTTNGIPSTATASVN